MQMSCGKCHSVGQYNQSKWVRYFLYKTVLLALFYKDDTHQFKPILVEIEEAPVNPLGKTVFWLVILTFAFFVTWAILDEIDIVVTAHGKVSPVGDIKVLQPLSMGVVRQIEIKEGDYVKKGQVLLTIDPATTETTLESSRQNLQYLEVERSRLRAVNGNGQFASSSSKTQQALFQAENQKLEKQIQGKQASIMSLNAKMQETQVELSHTKADLTIQQEKKSHLDEVRDLLTRDQYQEVTNKLLEDQTKVKALSYELEQLRQHMHEAEQDIAVIQQNFKTETLTDLSDKEKKITELKANVSQLSFQNAHQQIKSTVDGYVHELFIHTVGGVVTPAEKLLSIMPANAPLKIQSFVDGKDIGYVKKGMPVIIKLDTFDFQKYGTLKGKVSQIPPSSYISQSENPNNAAQNKEKESQGPVYLIDVMPLEHSLKVDGKTEKLSNGLSVTTELKIGKRKIIEFFIYPLIKHWNEGVSVR
jgi:hemolysin D